MPIFTNAEELLSPGEPGCSYSQMVVTINADGSGSTGVWVINPERKVDRVIVFREQVGNQSSELFSAKPNGVVPAADGRYSINLLDVQLAGSLEGICRAGGTKLIVIRLSACPNEISEQNRGMKADLHALRAELAARLDAVNVLLGEVNSGRTVRKYRKPAKGTTARYLLLSPAFSMSAAGRANIAAGMRERWRKAKRAGRSHV